MQESDGVSFRQSRNVDFAEGEFGDESDDEDILIKPSDLIC